ncbi:Scr1 family TA system antitoxin-like transcriptional regulator [Streptomyces lincolnensis]|uniref:Scr1 family TA system antitoxin-like transcriptional regulator n=1 Tax=Streptomyces lincolnensis TaxID=1915 RepID=UPI0037D8AE0D
MVRHIDELWLERGRQVQTGAETRQKKSLPVYAKTKVFQIWHPNMIWGTFQTADYAAEILQQAVRFLEFPNDIEAAVGKLLERRRYLYAGNRIHNVLLGEHALYSNVGGPAVMKTQLDCLLALMGLPRVSLGIVPAPQPLRSGWGTASPCSTTSSFWWRPTRRSSPSPSHEKWATTNRDWW